MTLLPGLVMVAIGVLIVVGIVVTPVWLAVEACKLALGRRRALGVARGRAAEELREQYASGLLSLVGLEERLDVTLRAESHFEVDSVLADLPPRRRASRVAVFEVAAGVFVLLVFSAAAARAAGAALALGSVAPPLRWRPVATAFLAGVALIAAPLAAIPIVASAGWRWAAGAR